MTFGLLVAAVLQASEEQGHGDGNITHRMMTFVLQLAVIIIAAKVGGFLAQRFLKIPEVLGELGAGAIIGPYALGGMSGFFTVAVNSAIPVSPEIYAIATLASIIMLYLVGLETDLRMFLRYSVTGSIVGVGGVLGSFILGDLVAVWLLPGVDSFMAPSALFLGVISTATSVGITARILAERRSLDTPEGVTILAGAVIDDILGIILLAVVISLSKLGADGGGNIPWGRVAWIGVRAFGFWLICTALCLLLANQIKRVLEFFGSRQTMATVSLGLALMLAGLAEMAQLAMIIGAYTMGLGLSRVDGSREMIHRLEPVYHTLVSVFFCVMGMMINISAMKGVIGFAVIYTLVAIFTKVLGCGLPVLARGFNLLGATRIGIGMLPRGEVALIVAGVGLASGIVENDVFGVALLMTVVTTIIAPLMLVRLIDKRSGLKDEPDESDEELPDLCCDFDTQAEAEYFLGRVLDTFRQEDCYVNRLSTDIDLYLIRKEDITVTIKLEDRALQIDCPEIDREFVKLVVMEAMSEVIRSFENLQSKGRERFCSQLLGR